MAYPDPDPGWSQVPPEIQAQRVRPMGQSSGFLASLLSAGNPFSTPERAIARSFPPVSPIRYGTGDLYGRRIDYGQGGGRQMDTDLGYTPGPWESEGISLNLGEAPPGVYRPSQGVNLPPRPEAFPLEDTLALVRSAQAENQRRQNEAKLRGQDWYEQTSPGGGQPTIARTAFGLGVAPIRSANQPPKPKAQAYPVPPLGTHTDVSPWNLVMGQGGVRAWENMGQGLGGRPWIASQRPDAQAGLLAAGAPPGGSAIPFLNKTSAGSLYSGGRSEATTLGGGGERGHWKLPAPGQSTGPTVGGFDFGYKNLGATLPMSAGDINSQLQSNELLGGLAASRTGLSRARQGELMATPGLGLESIPMSPEQVLNQLQLQRQLDIERMKAGAEVEKTTAPITARGEAFQQSGEVLYLTGELQRLQNAIGQMERLSPTTQDAKGATVPNPALDKMRDRAFEIAKMLSLGRQSVIAGRPAAGEYKIEP